MITFLAYLAGLLTLPLAFLILVGLGVWTGHVVTVTWEPKP